MLKKYMKYAATALAVASLSTFIIGCGDGVDNSPGGVLLDGVEDGDGDGGEGEVDTTLENTNTPETGEGGAPGAASP
jgi:hypothetical protein